MDLIQTSRKPRGNVAPVTGGGSVDTSTNWIRHHAARAPPHVMGGMRNSYRMAIAESRLESDESDCNRLRRGRFCPDIITLSGAPQRVQLLRDLRPKNFNFQRSDTKARPVCPACRSLVPTKHNSLCDSAKPHGDKNLYQWYGAHFLIESRPSAKRTSSGTGAPKGKWKQRGSAHRTGS